MNFLAVIATFSNRKKKERTFVKIWWFYLYLGYSECEKMMNQTAKKTEKYRAQQ